MKKKSKMLDDLDIFDDRFPKNPKKSKKIQKSKKNPKKSKIRNDRKSAVWNSPASTMVGWVPRVRLNTHLRHDERPPGVIFGVNFINPKNPKFQKIQKYPKKSKKYPKNPK